MAFWHKQKPKTEKFTLGLNARELEAAVAFMDWCVDHFEVMEIDQELALQAKQLLKSKITLRNKKEFMHVLLGMGIHSVSQLRPQQVEVRWVQIHTGKWFNFLVTFYADRNPEIKFKFTDKKLRVRALAYFFIWAAKQTPYYILPATEFLEMTRLWSRGNFTRAMTGRLLELLLQSQIKSINSFPRYVEVELHTQGHAQAHKYRVGLLGNRVTQVED